MKKLKLNLRFPEEEEEEDDEQEDGPKKPGA